MIVISNLTFGYDVNKLLWHDLNMSLPSSCVLIGENGSGKTTWIKIIAGLLYAQNGEIKYKDSKNYTSSVLLDSQFLFDGLDVKTHLEWLCSDQKYDLKQYEQIVDKFHINHILVKKISELSSGQRQWFAICMILSIKADIYLLDEPFRFLDGNHRKMLCDCLMEEMKEKCIIITAHERIDDLQMIHVTIPVGHGCE